MIITLDINYQGDGVFPEVIISRKAMPGYYKIISPKSNNLVFLSAYCIFVHIETILVYERT